MEKYPELPTEIIFNKNNDKYVYINIGDKDVFVCDVIGEDSIHPDLYITHQYCGGSVLCYDLKKYRALTCDRCNLRIEVPIKIENLNDLIRYFKTKEKPVEEIDRTQLLDID